MLTCQTVFAECSLKTKCVLCAANESLRAIKILPGCCCLLDERIKRNNRDHVGGEEDFFVLEQQEE